jgi:hypothetical protein
MRRFGVDYVDELLAVADYGPLAEISSIACGSPMFSMSAPQYGLPRPLFVFTECLCWLSQAIRSGVWTYYEATPRARQEALCKALQDSAPRAVAEFYERGMIDWEDEDKIGRVDRWIEANEGALLRWLRDFAAANRDAVLEVTA